MLCVEVMAGNVDLGKVSGATVILCEVCKGTQTLWVLTSNICDLRSGDSQHITSFRRAKTQHVRSVTQSCLTLCIPHGVRSPGSSVHGILQARILEWVAIPSSRGSFQSRD